MLEHLIRAASCCVSCGHRYGTGYLIRDDRVLTARHCVIDAIDSNSTITLKFPGTFRERDELIVVATVLAADDSFDTCILEIEPLPNRVPIPMLADLPREGVPWTAFGFPDGKAKIGQYLRGTVAQVLPAPATKIDIDLAVDPTAAIDSYNGMSGAAVVIGGKCIAILRLHVNGSVAAISVHSLVAFLQTHDVQPIEIEAFSSTRPELASRTDFQGLFEIAVLGSGGKYLLLEGVPGIGKTTFCEHFKPLDSQILCLGAYCVLESHGSSNAIARSQPEMLYDWMLTTISQELTGSVARYHRVSYGEMVQQITALLADLANHCAAKNKHALLFVDGLNEVHSAGSALLTQFAGLLPASLPANVTVVLSTPNFARIADQLAGRVSTDNVLALPLLSHDTCIPYCSQRLSVDRAFDYEFVTQLCERANGHPLYLNYLIRYANDSESISLDEFPVLDGPIEEYYERVWRDLSIDDNAINLLSLVCRLRQNLAISELHKVLSQPEQAVSISTIARIQHLFLHAGGTALYHTSFKEYLVDKTQSLGRAIHSRLADFCVRETNVGYCTRNRIFHLLNGETSDTGKAVELCTQQWVDECVLFSIEPDVLIEDLIDTIEVATSMGQVAEVIRLLLLYQRVSFRYDTLFAQSAHLVAEALLALNRPQDALSHVIRHNVLIMHPDDALKIAFLFIKNEYEQEALAVLALVERRCIAAWSLDEIDGPTFHAVAMHHLMAVLLRRLADGRSHMSTVGHIQHFVTQMIEANVPDQEHKDNLLSHIISIPNGYFVTFCDTYLTTQDLAKMHKELPKDLRLRWIVELLLTHMQLSEEYCLPKHRESLRSILTDIDHLVREQAHVPDLQAPWFCDALIRIGASPSLVDLLIQKHSLARSTPLDLRCSNGVDANTTAAYRAGIDWRAKGFNDITTTFPNVTVRSKDDWLDSLASIFTFVYYCDGRARRAKATSDEELCKEIANTFQRVFFTAVDFTLEERVLWERSYAIPEALLPLLYEVTAEFVFDCFPELTKPFLEMLKKRSIDQLGLYTEGFRKCIRRVVGVLVRHDVAPDVNAMLFELLMLLNKHVRDGVENRYELIPELLALISLLAQVGAHEEANRTYLSLLAKSMGPSWYKEDQFSLLTGTLAKISQDTDVSSWLPVIAGYLDRASGEMTFQRFVQQEKALFAGTLSARGLLKAACKYVSAQSCGDLTRLMKEWGDGNVDVPTPRHGYRYPGGAIDEQFAVAKIIESAKDLDCRLRWALLEVFQFGDIRHIDRYASEYAQILNEVRNEAASLNQLAQRLQLLFALDVPKDDRIKFAKGFKECLAEELRYLFTDILSTSNTAESDYPVFTPSAQHTRPSKVQRSREDDDDMHLPGVFGKQSALRDAETILNAAKDQITLGNIEAAKAELVRALEMVQKGGWVIWNSPARCTADIEELLKEHATNAEDLLRRYAPLIESERYVRMWKVAAHLIERISSLLNSESRAIILDNVLKHVHTIIGDATAEVDSFRFLAETDIPTNSSLHVFTFIMSLLDHPKWMHREKAAEVILWLVTQENDYFGLAAKTAFGMSSESAADVACGILDIISHNAEMDTWTRLEAEIDLEVIYKENKHVSRLATLHRIANRARNAGSETANVACNRITALFRTGTIHLAVTDSINLPAWASCVSTRWSELESFDVVTRELLKEMTEILSQSCTPFSIQDVYQLEMAVAKSFRAPFNSPFSRWEVRVRFALNCALFPYVSRSNLQDVESALRIFNPCCPCASRKPDFVPPMTVSWKSLIQGGELSNVSGDAENMFLHYYGLWDDHTGKMHDIEILAIVVPTSACKETFVLPDIEAVFSSDEYPNLHRNYSAHETCCHVIPKYAYFGEFTPAYPLPHFLDTISLKAAECRRVSWKRERAGDGEYLGRPSHEGCMLSINRSAVKLPCDQKLAWIVKANGCVNAVVDVEGNKLYFSR